jgi:hypothetical protein
MSTFKYDLTKVENLLNTYVQLVKNEIAYEIYVTGGGDGGYVWIEVVLKKTPDYWETVDFFIDDETGKFYHANEQNNDVIFLEKRKTKKAVKEFMLKIIKEKS